MVLNLLQSKGGRSDVRPKQRRNGVLMLVGVRAVAAIDDGHALKNVADSVFQWVGGQGQPHRANEIAADRQDQDVVDH